KEWDSRTAHEKLANPARAKSNGHRPEQKRSVVVPGGEADDEVARMAREYRSRLARIRDDKLASGTATEFAAAVRQHIVRHLIEVIRKMAASIGRRIDESVPMVDGRLPDGSRINAVIPPAAVDGPTLTVRKFTSLLNSLTALVNQGSLSLNMAVFLQHAVLGRANLLISGGTGSGKTTTLNVLGSLIPGTERVVTIEDTAELQLQHPPVVRIEYRPPNVEGRGELNIRQLLRNSLRMRPDRIFVGEARGA